MENLYFPLFLVVLAVGVIWLFNRAKSGGRARDSKRANRAADRFASYDPPPRRLNTRGSAARLQSGQGQSTPGDIWRTRREKVNKESFSQSASRGVYYAGYAGPDHESAGTTAGGELRDQKVSDTEHKGIDEYLSRRERERAEKAAEEEGGLTMTAMKYDPAGEESESEEKSDEKRRRQAGFKP